MSKLRFAIIIALLLGGPTTGVASGTRSDEGCEAQNPLRPKCSFTVTHTSSTPVTGAAGVGDWVVTVERGDRTFRIESLPDGRPTFLEFSYKIGDKVRARALSPGSGLTAGHFDP